MPFDQPLPIADAVSRAVAAVTERHADAFDAFATAVEHGIDALQGALLWLPPPVFIALTALLVLLARGPRRVAAWALVAFTTLGLALVWNLGYWQAMLQTLALVLAAELLVLLIGLPLGIASANSRVLDRLLRPLLDVMQTMPAFVYLVPAVLFFGLGVVPALLSTTVFALPPLVRLTALGVRQVPRELVEATQSFGATGWQLLLKVQLPSARASILAGINQSIMLGLSMVVIAAMIGAGGLGNVVLQGITQLDVGRGFVGGLCVVILAVVLDRVTEALGRADKERR